MLVLRVIDGEIVTDDGDIITRTEANRLLKKHTRKTARSNRKRAKLTPARVHAARQLYTEGFELHELAVVNSVSDGTMYNALTGKTWRDVPGAVKMRPPKNRGTRWVTIDGVTKSLHTWCTEFKTPYHRAKRRIDAGWDPEAAVKTPHLGQGGHSDRARRIEQQ